MSVNMRDHVRRVLLAMALSAIAPAVSSAQEPGHTPAQVLRDAQRLGWRLRVVTQTDTITGRLVARPVSDFRIGHEPLDTAAIRVIQRGRKHGNGWLRGAVIGGAVTGLAVSWLFSVGPFGNARPGFAAAMTITLSGLGSAIGAAVGSAAQPGRYEWRTLWPIEGSED